MSFKKENPLLTSKCCIRTKDIFETVVHAHQYNNQNTKHIRIVYLHQHMYERKRKIKLTIII